MFDKLVHLREVFSEHDVLSWNMTCDRVCTEQTERLPNRQPKGIPLALPTSSSSSTWGAAPSAPPMDQSMGEMRHGAPSLDLNASGPVCSAHPGESQASISIAVGEEIHGKDFLDDGTSVEFMQDALKQPTAGLGGLGLARHPSKGK